MKEKALSPEAPTPPLPPRVAQYGSASGALDRLNTFSKGPVFDQLKAAGVEQKAMLINGRKVAYLQSGRTDPDAPLLVMLHGTPEFSLSWANYLKDDKLKKKYKMVAIDLPAYGDSEAGSAENYKMRNLGNMVTELARRVGHNKFDLIGHDWGGLIAYGTAAQHKRNVRNLVVMNAPHPRHFGLIYADPSKKQYTLSHYLRELHNGGFDKNGIDNPDSKAKYPNGFGPASYAANNGELVKRVVFGLGGEFFKAPEMQEAYLKQWGISDGSSDFSRFSNQLKLYPNNDIFPLSLEDAQQAAKNDPMRVTSPTTLIWNPNDSYFSKEENFEGLEAFVPNLKIVCGPEGPGHGNHFSNHDMKDQTIDVLLKLPTKK